MGNTMSDNTLLLTVREVSQLLRIHRPKVYELIRANTIDGFKLGSDWRIRRESIEALIGPIPEDFFDGKKKSAKATDQLDAGKAA